jgi:hypothetical protein
VTEIFTPWVLEQHPMRNPHRRRSIRKIIRTLERFERRLLLTSLEIVEFQSQVQVLGGQNGLALIQVNDTGTPQVVEELDGEPIMPPGPGQTFNPSPSDSGYTPDKNASSALPGTDLLFFFDNTGGSSDIKYTPQLPQAVLYSGSDSDVQNRWNAAIAAAQAINEEQYKYFFSPIFGDRNINSAATTIIDAAIGPNVEPTRLPGEPHSREIPGRGKILLNNDEINQVQANYQIPSSSPYPTSAIVFAEQIQQTPVGTYSLTSTYANGDQEVDEIQSNSYVCISYNPDGSLICGYSYSVSSDDQLDVIAGGQCGLIDFDEASISLMPGTQATFSGLNNSINATAPGDSITLTGTGDLVSGASDDIALGAGTSGNTIAGSDNMIGADSGDSFTIDGTGDSIAATLDAVTLGAGDTGDTVSGTSNLIGAVAGDSFSVNGTGDFV